MTDRLNFYVYAMENRHFTREALPRLDNYRDILSIQAVYRPTLDDLHNATMSNKVRMNIWHGFSLKFTRKNPSNSKCRTSDRIGGQSSFVSPPIMNKLRTFR